MGTNAALTDDGDQQTDLYSHTYMCIICHHALTVHDFNFPVNVVGYDPLKGTMTPNRRTVLAAVAYYCPMTGEVFIIEIHQEILIDRLHNNILCSTHMGMYDVKVNDIAK